MNLSIGDGITKSVTLILMYIGGAGFVGSIGFAWWQRYKEKKREKYQAIVDACARQRREDYMDNMNA